MAYKLIKAIYKIHIIKSDIINNENNIIAI